MPIGPNGEKRPAAAEVNAVHVARIATREVEETYVDVSKRKGGLKGGAARANALSSERRSEIARSAAERRWARRREDGPTTFD